MKRVILLDADVPAYQFAARGQVEIDWEGDGEIMKIAPDEEHAVDMMCSHINDLQEELNADRTILCFSDAVRSNNWRLDVLPTYKWKRDASTRPLLHDYMEEQLEDNYEFFRKDSLEGDDILGILATNPDIIKGEKIIASIDKDMKTIPTRTYTRSRNTLFHIPKFGKATEVDVTEAQADWYWMFQTLIGDTTDGYRGFPGVGPVAAYKVIGQVSDGRTIEELWPAVVEFYCNKKLGKRYQEDMGKEWLTEEDALTQARVARIARAEDYNPKTQRVIPWSPK